LPYQEKSALVKLKKTTSFFEFSYGIESVSELVKLSNAKLVDRGTKMIMEATGVSYEKANELLLTQGSVRNATEYYYKNEAKG
jgi:hypothetical protein